MHVDTRQILFILSILSSGKGIGWVIALCEENGVFLVDLSRTMCSYNGSLKEAQRILADKKNHDGLTPGGLLARVGE